MKKGKKILIFIIFLLIILYVLYAVNLLLESSTDVYIIKDGKISQEENKTAYIIREEETIKGENIENGIYQIALEGQKVAKNESVFRYYSDSESEIIKKIAEIDVQIQEILKDEKNIPNVELKTIEEQLEEKISKLNTLNNVQEISEYKNSMESLINKKIKYIGEITTNKEVKTLVNERNKYESKLNTDTEYIMSNFSGIVSYRVDGFEQTLKKENFKNLTDEYLEHLELIEGQIISTSNECGKVINNFECYLAIVMDSEQAMKAKIGDKAILRLATNKELNSNIVEIVENGNSRTVIFQVSQLPTELVIHRKINLEIVWWNSSGLKVPNQAITEENGLNYVTKNKSGLTTNVFVKVIKQNEKFSIIEPYSNQEIQELDISDDEKKNYKKINRYDEIILKNK